MTEQQRTFRVGDIVREPDGILTMVAPDGKGDRTSDDAKLTYIGRIELTTPGRTATDGNRYRQCAYTGVDGETRSIPVCVRSLRDTSDIDDFTTQWHAFSILVADGIIV